MFTLFSPEDVRQANVTLLELLRQEKLRPAIARIFPLEAAAEAQRHLIDERPYGRVLLRV